MSEASVEYLHSLAHALASMQLYDPGHPARAEVVTHSFGKLRMLMLVDKAPSFSFIEGAVVYGNLPLHGLRDWPWARRLPDLGVQRLEFEERVAREAYGLFLDDVVSRIMANVKTETPPPPRPGIRCGSMRVTGAEDGTAETPGLPTVATLPYRLGEEADAVRWLYERASKHEELPLTEVEAVVRSLTVAMHADGHLVVPLLDLNDADQYASLHAINVSMLAMTVAEQLGMSSRDVRAFGTAGLLHDIGMTQIPSELLEKPSLTQEDWDVLAQHPAAGARLLLQRSDEHEIAAIAAYEHHARPDGGGYPTMRFPRDHHYVSKVIAVCDSYDALRAPKPYREPWTQEQVLSHIEGGAGSLFDRHLATMFVGMLRRLDEHKLLLTSGTQERLPPPRSDGAEPEADESPGPAPSPGPPAKKPPIGARGKDGN
jgi:putative nucleotidyltransferase with HDIG domain